MCTREKKKIFRNNKIKHALFCSLVMTCSKCLTQFWRPWVHSHEHDTLQSWLRNQSQEMAPSMVMEYGGGCSILWVVKAKFRIKRKLPPIMQFRSNSSGTIGWHHQWQGLSYHYDGSGNRSPALACPQRFKSKLHSMEALTALHLSLSLSFPAMGRAILLDQRSNVDTKRQWWASQGCQNWSPRITEEHPGEHSILVSVTQGHATVAFLQQKASAAWRVLRSTSSYKQNPQPKPKQTNKQNKATKIQSNGINLEIPVPHSPTCE